MSVSSKPRGKSISLSLHSKEEGTAPSSISCLLPSLLVGLRLSPTVNQSLNEFLSQLIDLCWTISNRRTDALAADNLRAHQESPFLKYTSFLPNLVFFPIEVEEGCHAVSIRAKRETTPAPEHQLYFTEKGSVVSSCLCCHARTYSICRPGTNNQSQNLPFHFGITVLITWKRITWQMCD